MAFFLSSDCGSIGLSYHALDVHFLHGWKGFFRVMTVRKVGRKYRGGSGIQLPPCLLCVALKTITGTSLNIYK